MSQFQKNDKLKKKIMPDNKKLLKKVSKEEYEFKKPNKQNEKEKEKEKKEKEKEKKEKEKEKEKKEKEKKEKEKEKALNIVKEKLSEKIITNEPIEKEMLKGQEHKEHKEEETKEENIIETNIEVSSNNNSLSPRKDKDVIEIKPREAYLKEKMMKMNYSAKLINTINKSLDNQIKNIHNELMDNQVLITAVSKNIKKLINSPTSLSSVDFLRKGNFDTKSKLKTIKELKNEEEKIKNNLKQLLENEKLIKDESFSKLYSLKQSQSNLSLDRILKIEQLKKIDSKKNSCINQINEIEFKINEIINNNNELTRKNKMKLFLDNFERDREIAEIRAKKYYKESKQISLRMEKDIQQIVGKVKKEIEEKEKEDQKKKLEMLEDFKKKEKAIEQKRYKEYIKKALVFKNFVADKPKLKIKDYLFSKKSEKYMKEEAKAIRLENNKRKAYMKSVTKEELNEFANNFNENKEKHNSIKEEKRQKLFSEWKERKGLLPTYVSSFSEAASNEAKKLEEEEILKGERIQTLIKLKKDFSNQIKEEKQPPINKKLKQKRLEEIDKLENPKNFLVKATLSKRKKKRILLKKRDPNKPSRFKWKLKLEEDPFEKINKSDSISDSFIRKPKKIRVSSSFENKEHKPLDKKIDYLREMTIKREEKEKRRNLEGINLSSPKSREKKWNAIINKFDGNIMENVNNIKQKADHLEQEASMKEKILNLNGGIENNPELGQKVSCLLIDSIEAKLSILNKITQDK